MKDFNYSFQVGVSLPVFDGFQTDVNIRRARLEYLRSEENLTQTEKNIKLNLKIALLGVEEAEKRIAASEEAVKAAEESFKFAQERYNFGAGTILERLEAQVRLTSAQADHVRALYDYKLAQAVLALEIGKPVPR